MPRPRKGKWYLYRCDECGTKRQVTPKERNRAAKPRCLRCGCTRLELVSEDAHQDVVRLTTEAITNRSFVRSRHSLMK